MEFLEFRYRHDDFFFAKAHEKAGIVGFLTRKASSAVEYLGRIPECLFTRSVSVSQEWPFIYHMTKHDVRTRVLAIIIR
jgi:hypothetical protein